jgi:hypothetical protein
VLADDACATHERTGPDGTHFSAELMHATALASLDGEFARTMRSADILGRID